MPGNAPIPEVEPDLEYTRKATDLVLEYLKDQQRKADPDLLDNLGWTKDQLDAFLKRWESLKREAEEDASARDQFDATLRSLGLRPPRDSVQSGRGKDDAKRGNADSALRSSPPSKYAEQFNAFRKGAARSEESPSSDPRSKERANDRK
ncbi:MAG: hypothetical protein FJ297_01630 [Planctomycetes bacterium]|nr:hypothetical protein [Planctomycetota bacterium]